MTPARGGSALTPSSTTVLNLLSDCGLWPAIRNRSGVAMESINDDHVSGRSVWMSTRAPVAPARNTSCWARYNSPAT
ncbi:MULTISPECIES: hypothetical protein [unclassified Rhodococcus (in: high G+C Gram-positive bacteria)]|uniref:hypothetical protein n=1 Tax=unclassified Rhodococcus (in: high G+C Gram-positive bacteria) TaxID=192944 RepID=UPI001ED8E2D9|nr:hypothetical protein [Rhodococcus sp. DK17]